MAEARYGFFAIWVTLAILGILLFYTGLLGYEALGLMLPLALALLVVFTGGIAINLIRGTAFGCGCFSNSATAKPMDWMNVARNTALIALVGLALLANKRRNMSFAQD